MNRIPKGESLMKSTKIKKRIAPENKGRKRKIFNFRSYFQEHIILQKLYFANLFIFLLLIHEK
jgi:hypothetical protein